MERFLNDGLDRRARGSRLRERCGELRQAVCLGRCRFGLGPKALMPPATAGRAVRVRDDAEDQPSGDEGAEAPRSHRRCRGSWTRRAAGADGARSRSRASADGLRCANTPGPRPPCPRAQRNGERQRRDGELEAPGRVEARRIPPVKRRRPRPLPVPRPTPSREEAAPLDL